MRTAILTSLVAAAPAVAQGDGFWEPRPALQVARQEVAAATLANGSVYVAGGLDTLLRSVATVERLDSITGTWSFVAPLPTTLHHFGLAAAGGRLYAVGGYVSAFTGVRAVHAYDSLADVWTTVAPLPNPRGALAAVALGGKIYAIGGVDPSRGVVGDLTEYDPLTNQWTQRAPMQFAREHLAAAVLDGKIYACGGRLGFGREQRSAEVYDPLADQWTRLPDMNVVHGGTGAAALRGKIIVCGGEAPAGITPEVEEYDPVRGTWRLLAPMATPVHGMYPVTLNDEIMVAGGAIVPGFGAVTTVQSFRYLPDGVGAFGVSRSCLGPVYLGVNRRPLVGTQGFGFLVSENVAAGTMGFLAVDATAVPAGTPLLGLLVFVGLGPGTIVVPAATPGPFGVVPGTLPASFAGLRFFAQTAWLQPNPCAQPAYTSDAIAILLR